VTAIYAAGLAIALAVSGYIFSRRALLLFRLIRSGKPAARFADVPARAKAEAVVVVGQSKLLQRLVPGLMHAAIFWGFLVLFPTILIAMIGAVDPHTTLPWLGAQGWYALLVDVFALLVLAGVVTAFVIRKVQRPARFAGSHLADPLRHDDQAVRHRQRADQPPLRDPVPVTGGPHRGGQRTR